MAVADRHGLPVAVHVESATPHEVKLVVPTLIEMVIPEAPQNLVGDNAYDSDDLEPGCKPGRWQKVVSPFEIPPALQVRTIKKKPRRRRPRTQWFQEHLQSSTVGMA